MTDLDKNATRPSHTHKATAMSVSNAGHGKHKVKLALAHNGFGIHLVMDRKQADWLCEQVNAAFGEVSNECRD